MKSKTFDSAPAPPGSSRTVVQTCGQHTRFLQPPRTHFSPRAHWTISMSGSLGGARGATEAPMDMLPHRKRQPFARQLSPNSALTTWRGPVPGRCPRGRTFGVFRGRVPATPSWPVLTPSCSTLRITKIGWTNYARCSKAPPCPQLLSLLCPPMAGHANSYEGKAVIRLSHNLIRLSRADGPPLAREATAGSPAHRARQSN